MIIRFIARSYTNVVDGRMIIHNSFGVYKLGALCALFNDNIIIAVFIFECRNDCYRYDLSSYWNYVI